WRDLPVILREKCMIGDAQHLCVRDRETAGEDLTQHETGERVPRVAAAVSRHGRAQPVETKSSRRGVAVVRVQHQHLIAETELETVVTFDPGYGFIQPEDGVVFIPQLGAVPTVKIVVAKGYRREACVIARIILHSWDS